FPQAIRAMRRSRRLNVFRASLDATRAKVAFAFLRGFRANLFTSSMIDPSHPRLRLYFENRPLGLAAERAICLSLSKSTDSGLRHQRRPDFRQHFLKRLPDPHGQRSLRPSFSASSLQPWTMRRPRLTFVSEGKPLRRLLIVS